jgi:hypothetical protein
VAPALVLAGLLLLIPAGIVLWIATTPRNRPEPVTVATPDPPAAQPPSRVTREPVEAAPTIAKPLPPEPPPAVVKPPPAPTEVKPELPAPTVARPPEPPPPVVAKPVPAALAKGPFKEGDTFLQELVVTQKSRFGVQGITVTSLLQYRVVSRFTVQKVEADGSLAVGQKVEAAELLQADDLTKGLLAEPVARLPGASFTLQLGPRGEVTQLAGAAAAVQVGAAKVPGGIGLQTASLLDADGWKEVAQMTFFRPEQPARAGRWSRPMTHAWGPLGGWAGQVHYAYPGPESGPVAKVAYALELAYQPPKGPAAGLPFQVTAAHFQPPQAGGTISFDVSRGKPVAAEERFVVRGVITVNLLGQNTPAEVEEDQLFQMRVVEK